METSIGATTYSESYTHSNYGTQYSTLPATEALSTQKNRARADNYDLFLLIQDMLCNDEDAILELPIDVWGRDDTVSISLGAGGFSTVSRKIAKGRWGKRSVMAYKRIRPSFDYDGKVDEEGALEQFVFELKVLSAPDIRSHRHINRVRGIAFETLPHRSGAKLFPVLITDPSPLGNLLQFIQDPVRMVDGPYWECCLDVARGLRALHRNGFIHGDVKCENVLVFPSNELEGRKFMAKLTDFGCSMMMDADEPSAYTKMRGLTPPYDAPEADGLLHRELLPFTDVYSYGLLVWRVAIDGADPFNQPRYRPSKTVEGAHSFNHALIREDKRDETTLSLALNAIYHEALGLAPATADGLSEVLTIALSSEPAERDLGRVLEVFERRKSDFERRLFGLTPTNSRFLREFIKHDTAMMREFAAERYGVAEWNSVPPKAHHLYHIAHKYGSIDANFRGFGESRISPQAECIKDILLCLESIYFSIGRAVPEFGLRCPIPPVEAGPNHAAALASATELCNSSVLNAIYAARHCRDRREFNALTGRLSDSIDRWGDVLNSMSSLLSSVVGPRPKAASGSSKAFAVGKNNSILGVYDRPGGLAADDAIVMMNEHGPAVAKVRDSQPSSCLNFHILSTCRFPVSLQEQLFLDISSRSRRLANTAEGGVLAMEEAICYSIGFGVAQDHRRSLSIITDCCKLGYGPAQEVLPRILDGLGLPPPENILSAPWFTVTDTDGEKPMLLSGVPTNNASSDTTDVFKKLSKLNLSQIGHYSDTALIAACQAGNLNLFNNLLDQGANPKATNALGESALHWIWKFDATSLPSIVARLVRAGADPNAIAGENPSSAPYSQYHLVRGTTLHRAVSQGDLASVQALISHGASVTQAVGPVFFHNGHSRQLDPIQLACTWHDVKITELLLDSMPMYPVNADGNAAVGLLYFAVQCQSTAERMAKHGSNHFFALQAIMHLLISRGCTETVDSNGLTALQLAVESDSREVLEYMGETDLFMESINTLAKGKSALHRAIARGRTDIFELLIKHGANLLQPPTGGYALDFAIELAPGNDYFVRAIIGLGGEAITEDEINRALVQALLGRRWELAEFLLGIGANINGRNPSSGLTPNGHTVFSDVVNQGKLIEVLPALDTILSLAEKYGQKPDFIASPDLQASMLHISAGHTFVHEQEEAARLYTALLALFPEREHLEARDSRGWTALHLAISTRNVVAVRALLDAGADVNSMALIEGSPAGPSTKDLLFTQLFAREGVYDMDPSTRNAGDRALEQLFKIYREHPVARTAKRSTTLRAEQRLHVSARDRRVMDFVEVLSFLPDSLPHEGFGIMGKFIDANAVGEGKNFMRNMDLTISDIARRVQWSGIENVRFLKHEGQERLTIMGLWDDYIDYS
ncbi:hypothetical protein FQN54_001045 [Arachnomyces sp. PD_36]|nr:hypothetical protein FQN54_001045 [Arachnomyces sp. PD_36]